MHYKNLSLENINGEIWKHISGYEGKYLISNYGRIKSIYNYRRKNEIILKQKINFGYCVCHLSNIKIKNYRVHRLVAIAFIKIDPERNCVNHIDGNKTNNFVDNLEWVTNSENDIHAYRTGLRVAPKSSLGKLGKNNPLAKAVLQYDLNDNFIAEFGSIIDVVNEYGFNKGNISSCCNGKRNVANNYKWRFKNENNE